MKRNKQWRGVLVAALMLFAPLTSYADTSSSANYRVDQTFFGSGGELNACSTAYCSKQSVGELAVGNTNSTNYGAYAGFNTTDDPYIEFVTTGGHIDLGILSTSNASVTSAPFYVRAWQASGYVVQTQSDPPSSNGYFLTALTSQTASSVGSEQFGINLVANTTPYVIGADAQQVPDPTFSSGVAATGYDTPDVYKYVKGDVIASSSKSTSVTIYTVSYLFNINNTTPAGLYTFVHNMVATGTY